MTNGEFDDSFSSEVKQKIKLHYGSSMELPYRRILPIQCPEVKAYLNAHIEAGLLFLAAFHGITSLVLVKKTSRVYETVVIGDF